MTKTLLTFISVLVLFSSCSKKKETCSDGKLNQGESQVDCGGPCTSCPTCIDGLMNQGESAVDCGGPCPSCPSCNDNIQNQGEIQIDCGGPCIPCQVFFPSAGQYGTNVFNTTQLAFNSSTQGSPLNQYSFTAEVPKGSNAKIIMKNTTTSSNSIWYMYNASIQNWQFETYDTNTGIQTFYANSDKHCDLQMFFNGAGSATIEFYINGSTTVTRTKNITWQ